MCIQVDGSTDRCYEYFLTNISLYTGFLGYCVPYDHLTSTTGTRRPCGNVYKHRSTMRLTRSGSCERRRVMRSCSRWIYSCSLRGTGIVLFIQILTPRISCAVGRSSSPKRREISRRFALSLISCANYYQACRQSTRTVGHQHSLDLF
jgi:hypothetical protein